MDEIRHLPEIILNKLRTEYRRYQVSGGMPEAVVALLEDKGVGVVDATLQDILDLYELDFAKYAEPREIPRIHVIWHSLPAQLAKVEFVIQWDEKIIPIEVKAEGNISGNSLSEYNNKYAPQWRIRFSMLNLQFNGDMLSSPLPLAGWLDKLMKLISKSAKIPDFIGEKVI